jgi:hypothetical protein
MKQDPKFTEQLQAWINTPDAQKNWDEGAILLLQLSGNKIMYRNISVNPKGKAEFIKGQLQKYLNFRLQQLTKEQVQEMQDKVEDIVAKVIKPFAITESLNSGFGKSEEFAEFKAGKRADHDMLPAEIQALYVENLDLIHRMRELHLRLRTLSLDEATCPDSERYPFLKEIIALDKKRVENWDIYDHFIPGTPAGDGSAAPEPEDDKADETEDTSVNSEGLTKTSEEEEQTGESEPTSDNPLGLTETAPVDTPAEPSDNPQGLTEDAAVKEEQPAPAEAKPKRAKAATKRTTKKTAKK